MEVVAVVGDGFNHSLGHCLDFACIDEGLLVGLELVKHLGGANHEVVAVVADALCRVAEEAPLLKVRRQVVTDKAAGLANVVEHEGDGVFPLAVVLIGNIFKFRKLINTT